MPTRAGNGAELAVGLFHTCARSTMNRLFCWGENGGGQVGDGTTTDRLSPTPVVNVPPPP
jgi:hypothetical protein